MGRALVVCAGVRLFRVLGGVAFCFRLGLVANARTLGILLLPHPLLLSLSPHLILLPRLFLLLRYDSWDALLDGPKTKKVGKAARKAEGVAAMKAAAAKGVNRFQDAQAAQASAEKRPRPSQPSPGRTPKRRGSSSSSSL